MNQPRSIYKTDYASFDWMENNFSSESNDFCSSENIDECLRHISQELSALGYPSIYSSSSDCGYAVNCDIVRLLNVTFELIGSCRDHVQIKDDLECSNRRLSSDLHALSRKNAQLKESLEQSENKYKSVLEKERQLKEKYSRLLQTIKNEKEESKRLSSQIQQQKVAYQHEIRKYENNINQMKARLNQIISDRNPDKKVASISPSNLLQRNSKQRGKWKTGSVAKSCVEEMYSSVISSYENRCQGMLKEIYEYRSGLEQIQQQIVEIDLSLGGDSQDLVNSIPLSAIWNGADLPRALKDRFQFLLNKLKETALKIATKSPLKSEDGSTLLKLKLSAQEKLTGVSQACGQLPISKEKSMEDNELGNCFENLCLDTLKEQLEAEKENLMKEKLQLSATASCIEKEKSDLAVQKLQVIQLAMQQESPSSQWHQSLNTLSSFSVITSQDGSTLVPSAKELKQCLSAPDHPIQSITPLWKAGNLVTMKEKTSKSEMTIQPLNLDLPVETCSPNESKNIDPENSNLPKWALAAMNSTSHPFQSQDVTSICETSVAESISNEELELSTASSYEQNLELLKAAMEDIEKRRNQVSR
ncbi:unnamed protein product [Larinioides sclopetarius]|uniref:Afadin-and alpha-actinin-binding protein n=1 Tax=Larinioides sclopetarius TaxID=280406 RepID=A0AAV2ATK7_9ARAC